MKRTDYTSGTLRPTDTSTYYPDDLISDEEERIYEEWFGRFCGALIWLVILLATWFVLGGS